MYFEKKCQMRLKNVTNKILQKLHYLICNLERCDYESPYKIRRTTRSESVSNLTPSSPMTPPSTSPPSTPASSPMTSPSPSLSPPPTPDSCYETEDEDEVFISPKQAKHESKFFMDLGILHGQLKQHSKIIHFGKNFYQF